MSLSRRLKSTARNVARQVPHPITLRAFNNWWHLNRGMRFEYYRQRAGISSLVDLQPYRSSDTVFILGSGGSINEISDDRWSGIRRHDSFGFNFSLVHPHTPTLFAFEYYGPSQHHYAKFVEHARLRTEYRGIPKVFAHIFPQPFEEFFGGLPDNFRENLFAAFPVYTFARTRAELRHAIEMLDAQGLWSPHDWERQFKYRGSLSMMLSLAVKMGYKKIVLCGVDLNNWAYFFDDADLFPSMADFSKKGRKNKVHGTFERRKNVMPMDEIVYLMDEMLFRPRGIELFVENRSSALHPRVPAAPDALFAT